MSIYGEHLPAYRSYTPLYHALLAVYPDRNWKGTLDLVAVAKDFGIRRQGLHDMLIKGVITGPSFCKLMTKLRAELNDEEFLKQFDVFAALLRDSHRHQV